MPRFAAFLRAVNVGGRVVKSDLLESRALEKALGRPTTLRNVNTIRRMAERFGPTSARRSSGT